jgi:hypothetical protein
MTLATRELNGPLLRMNLSHNSETGSSNVFRIPAENINDHKLMTTIVVPRRKSTEFGQ